MAVMRKCVAVLAVGILLPALLLAGPGESGALAQASGFVRAGKLHQAENVLRTAVAAYPKSESIHAALGRVLFKQQKYEDAVQELGLALQINPGSLPNSLLLSEALIGWGHFGVAAEFLQAVQNKFDKDAVFHYDLGLAYYSENKIKEAKAEFQEAVQLGPELDRAQYLLAACIATEGDYSKAVEMFRSLVKQHPTNAMYWITLGQMLPQLGSDHLPEALQACRRARTLKPHDPHIQYVTATVLMQNGDFAAARPLFEHLANLDPKELSAHVALARIYSRLGERELARKETAIVNQIQQETTSQNTSATKGNTEATQPH